MEFDPEIWLAEIGRFWMAEFHLQDFSFNDNIIFERWKDHLHQ